MTAERQRLIAGALGREPETILEVDDGYDFEVAIVDDDWVFRFPRRSGVAEVLELETPVLPALALSLPVLVPSFEYVSHNPFSSATASSAESPSSTRTARGSVCGNVP
jgi:hypothetical protein